MASSEDEAIVNRTVVGTYALPTTKCLLAHNTTIRTASQYHNCTQIHHDSIHFPKFMTNTLSFQNYRADQTFNPSRIKLETFQYYPFSNFQEDSTNITTTTFKQTFHDPILLGYHYSISQYRTRNK